MSKIKASIRKRIVRTLCEAMCLGMSLTLTGTTSAMELHPGLLMTEGAATQEGIDGQLVTQNPTENPNQTQINNTADIQGSKKGALGKTDAFMIALGTLLGILHGASLGDA